MISTEENYTEYIKVLIQLSSILNEVHNSFDNDFTTSKTNMIIPYTQEQFKVLYTSSKKFNNLRITYDTKSFTFNKSIDVLLHLKDYKYCIDYNLCDIFDAFYSTLTPNELYEYIKCINNTIVTIDMLLNIPYDSDDIYSLFELWIRYNEKNKLLYIYHIISVINTHTKKQLDYEDELYEYTHKIAELENQITHIRDKNKTENIIYSCINVVLIVIIILRMVL